MSELLEIIVSAIDEASSVFEGIGDTAGASAEQLQADFEQATANVEQLEQELAAIYMGDVEGDAEAVEQALASAQAEAESLAQAIDSVEQESEETKDSLEGMESLMAFQQISDWVGQAADAMWDMADKAGTVQDSINRASLEAEGFGISAEDMKNTISELSAETGRAGGQLRESFIKAAARGVTDLGSFKQMMEGAGAQAYLFGTDIQTMADKFSSMALRSSVAERQLGNTGITVDELGTALGMQGASLDEINAKWETMDTNARAAALGQAAAMNEGKNANSEYKTSWEGLQNQIDKAKGKLEVLVGNVLLPVLIPAMDAASRVLDWLGNTISSVMDGPLGTLITILGSAGAGLILLLGAITAVTAGMGFFTASLLPAITASWALLAPWLPWIAIGAAIIGIIYEIGIAFGWWTDASSMLDAIGAGLQRLWSAFINHPDVQAAIAAISNAISVLWGWIQQAGQAVLDFFGINTSGNFDIVRSIIDGVGAAWEAMSAPIKLVIGVIQWLINTFSGLWSAGTSAWNGILGVVGPVVSQIITFIYSLIGIFNLFKSGQMSLPQFIWAVLMKLWNAYLTVTTTIGKLILKWAGQLLQYAIRAGTNFVNGIINKIRNIRNKVLVILLNVITIIKSAIQKWVDAAKQKAQKIVDGVGNVLSDTASAVTNALSGVKDAIVKPFKDAYDSAKKVWDDIVAMATNTPKPAAGGEVAAGGETGVLSYKTDNSPIEVNQNLTLDFKNVPSHLDTNQLVEALTEPSVLMALTGNSDFQRLDAKVKQRLQLKVNRSRGV